MRLKENNSSLKKILKRLNKLVQSTKSPVIHAHKIQRYNDEPLLYQYTARSKNYQGTTESVWGVGTSFQQELALIKAYGETIERYCNGLYDEKLLLSSNIKNINSFFLNPLDIKSFTTRQLLSSNYLKFRLNSDSIFYWTQGYSITHNKKCLIPAQLVYNPYLYKKDESYIQFPITTGTALGSSIQDAVYRGACEVIERDSFMIYYLSKSIPKKIDLQKSSKKLNHIFNYFQRYYLDVLVFDITSDLEIPVFLAVILDKTTIGPSISLGLKCSWNSEEAIIGAIEEAQQIRPWMRDEYIKAKVEARPIPKGHDEIVNPLTRGLFWYEGKLLKSLSFWLDKTIEAVPLSINKEILNYSREDLYSLTIKQLKNKNIDIYYTNLTPSDVSDNEFFVIKTLLPSLQPLYLDERYPYWGCERIKNVPILLKLQKQLSDEEFNTIPHPFL